MTGADNVVAFTGKVRYRRGGLAPTSGCLIIRDDGTLGFVPQDDRPTEAVIDLKEDWAAEQRLAQAALERDDGGCVQCGAEIAIGTRCSDCGGEA